MLEFHHFRLCNPWITSALRFSASPISPGAPTKREIPFPMKDSYSSPSSFFAEMWCSRISPFLPRREEKQFAIFQTASSSGGGREKVEQEDPSGAPSGKKFIFLQRTASSMYTSISPGLFTQSQRPATNPSGRMHTCTYTAPFTVSPSFYLL